MPFWSSGQVEPKRQFRFKVTIAGMPDGAEFYARSATKPSLVDPVAPDATGNILTILKQSGYNVPANLSEANAFSTIGKANSTAALIRVSIRALDENGDELEEWVLNNPFIVGLQMNEYSYEGEDLSTLDIEFRYDWASYIIPEGRVPGPGGAAEENKRLFTL